MVSDAKKVQTMINVAAEQLTIMRTAASTLSAVRVAFTSANPSVTGTPLDGYVTVLASALTDLETQVNKAIWSQLIAAHVPTHRNQALEY